MLVLIVPLLYVLAFFGWYGESWSSLQVYLSQLQTGMTCIVIPNTFDFHYKIPFSSHFMHFSVFCQGACTRGVLPCLPYSAIPVGHALLVSMQAPFLYRVTPSRRHCRSQEFCGRPLGLLQVGLSLTETTRLAGSASGFRATCPYSRSWR